METFEAIKTRRSIRKYEELKVPDELIQKLLSSAMQAPSAGNQQPWHFIVITDKNILQQCSKIHVNAPMAKDAALAILVCGDVVLERHKDYWPQDCSAAIQNVLLAAHDMGFGAVWCGVYPRKERVDGFKKFFNLPENVIPFALIPIGYPAEKKSPDNRFKEDRVHYNKW
ncbi:NADH dehydrogenase [candidate division WOR-1 bacterium RIFOXYA2_FULL_36_21]|uniref:NADH dehydrogenase n=1 Tax=candidate division WOR-1 bacterium RIFOXYB2_FULL_36_35 TaxID=1802578 RepID=A0A1F4RZH5_UNCSA|nr:MAG: NADH dehydrogenase [candidate division WOR-1 bacterium RIFOXYA2_FULL_36_21]OGC13582.1 MAG: NADH dehydrogenase [candidate division WOR-1 bacterium RIFOXYB2_FULL_36_35]OGC16487.1 MAG: NADH dehydrogenase [candidate division WOR-1 bacterium RIFOXYA12_FULL_36_13]